MRSRQRNSVGIYLLATLVGLSEGISPSLGGAKRT
jgi:hypothetical protein